MNDKDSLYESILKDIRVRKLNQQRGTSRSDDLRLTSRSKNEKEIESKTNWGSKSFSKLDDVGQQGVLKSEDKKSSVISSVENIDKLTDYLDYFEEIVLKTKKMSTDTSDIDYFSESTSSEAISDLTAENIHLERQKYIMKIILIGDGAVGKTSIRRNYLGESFQSDYYMTIGADFAIKDVTLSNGIDIKYQIWDLAGQPIFRIVRNSYYDGCFGAIVVFDLSKPRTFSNAILWINELWKANGQGPIPVVFIGNKFDLVNKEVDVINQAFKFTQMFSKETERKKGFVTPLLITSAKTGLNVNNAFDLLGQSIFSWIANKKH